MLLIIYSNFVVYVRMCISRKKNATKFKLLSLCGTRCYHQQVWLRTIEVHALIPPNQRPSLPGRSLMIITFNALPTLWLASLLYSFHHRHGRNNLRSIIYSLNMQTAKAHHSKHRYQYIMLTFELTPLTTLLSSILQYIHKSSTFDKFFLQLSTQRIIHSHRHQDYTGFGIKGPIMRQRSRFSKTLLCLLLTVTPDDAISKWAVTVPSAVGIEPPPRTLQSADDKPPINTIPIKCTTTIVHQVRLTCVKKYDEVRHPAPCRLFLYDCNHFFSGIVQSIIAILYYAANIKTTWYDKVRVW